MRECDFMDYDPGLINDFGGGDVAWWTDYLVAEIGRCNDHWREQLESANTAVVITDDDCIGDDELYTEWYRCPSCGDSNITASSNYCPHCGVRVKLVDPWHKD